MSSFTCVLRLQPINYYQTGQIYQGQIHQSGQITKRVSKKPFQSGCIVSEKYPETGLPAEAVLGAYYVKKTGAVRSPSRKKILKNSYKTKFLMQLHTKKQMFLEYFAENSVLKMVYALNDRGSY